jgi:hypothetical protein
MPTTARRKKWRTLIKSDFETVLEHVDAIAAGRPDYRLNSRAYQRSAGDVPGDLFTPA